MGFGGLEPGTVVAREFIVEELVGEGGMGAVYAVMQPSTGKRRALKVMHRQIAADESLQRRFEQEARIGARIESEHVVEVLTAGVDAGTGLPYLVMELLEGEPLRRRLDRAAASGAGLSAIEVRAIFEQLCHALAAAHRAGIVHRDLKPENVFLARARRATGSEVTVKMLDFGIAKLLAETSAATRGGIGSPQWMAPEQTEAGPVTAATDVWPLGLIAYEAFTGKSFWRAVNERGGTTAQLLREIVLDPIPSGTARAREHGLEGRLPTGFDGWLARCLAREPADRFADASLAWNAMEKLGAQADALSDTWAAPAPSSPSAARDLEGDTRDAIVVGPSVREESAKRPETPLASVQSAPPGAVTASTSSRWTVPLLAGGGLAIAGLLGGLWVARSRPLADVADPVTASPAPRTSASASASEAPTASATATANTTATATATANTTATATATATASAPAIAAAKPAAAAAAAAASSASTTSTPPSDTVGGFSNPFQIEGRATQWRVQGKHVRLFTKLVSNKSNVADAVVRKSIEWQGWQYLRCYERVLGGAKELPTGVVTVAYDILDQLPRNARLVSSTFGDATFDTCVVGTLVGQTMNAAGPRGAGTATHAFKFVPME